MILSLLPFVTIIVTVSASATTPAEPAACERALRDQRDTNEVERLTRRFVAITRLRATDVTVRVTLAPRTVANDVRATVHASWSDPTGTGSRHYHVVIDQKGDGLVSENESSDPPPNLATLDAAARAYLRESTNLGPSPDIVITQQDGRYWAFATDLADPRKCRWVLAFEVGSGGAIIARSVRFY